MFEHFEPKQYRDSCRYWVWSRIAFSYRVICCLVWAFFGLSLLYKIPVFVRKSAFSYLNQFPRVFAIVDTTVVFIFSFLNFDFLWFLFFKFFQFFSPENFTSEKVSELWSSFACWMKCEIKSWFLLNLYFSVQKSKLKMFQTNVRKLDSPIGSLNFCVSLSKSQNFKIVMK